MLISKSGNDLPVQFTYFEVLATNKCEITFPNQFFCGLTLLLFHGGRGEGDQHINE